LVIFRWNRKGCYRLSNRLYGSTAYAYRAIATYALAYETIGDIKKSPPI